MTCVHGNLRVFHELVDACHRLQNVLVGAVLAKSVCANFAVCEEVVNTAECTIVAADPDVTSAASESSALRQV